MNRFDPPPDLGNANVGNIDKLLMRANPLAGLPVFLCDKPGKRLPCLHEQTFAGQRTANSEAESWQEASGCRACTSRHLPGNGQRAAKLRAVRYRGRIGEPLSGYSLEHPNERWKYDERISGKCKKYSTAGT